MIRDDGTNSCPLIADGFDKTKQMGLIFGGSSVLARAKNA
jgi:hypothetical protein